MVTEQDVFVSAETEKLQSISSVEACQQCCRTCASLDAGVAVI